MKKALIILLSIVVLLLFLTFINYNSLIRLDENVENKWSQVENQLQRRSDLIPNLVSTVKGYASHEKDVFIDVSKARSNLIDANTPQEKAEANEKLTQALNSINVVVERYPELKSDKSFIRLQDELAGTENRIAIARKDYNESVKRYNSRIRRFPSNIIANMFNFDKREYFKATEEAKTAPKVEF